MPNKILSCGCILKDGGILILCPEHLKEVEEKSKFVVCCGGC